MEVTRTILMLSPFVFALAYYSFPQSDSRGIIMWLWAVSSVACLACGFRIRRKHAGLAWACLAIGCIQFVLMTLLGLKPQKTREPVTLSVQAARPKTLQATAATRPS